MFKAITKRGVDSVKEIEAFLDDGFCSRTQAIALAHNRGQLQLVEAGLITLEQIEPYLLNLEAKP